MVMLKWQNVHLDQGGITVISSTTKSKKTRHARMTEQVKEMLRTSGPGNPGELVFTGEDGKPLQKISNTFPKAVNEIDLNSGIDEKDRTNRIVFHSCRHSFASWHAMQGASMTTLQELLGHSSLIMTQRYSHLSPKHLEEAALNFENNCKSSKKKQGKKSA